jgi:hypothetical protein
MDAAMSSAYSPKTSQSSPRHSARECPPAQVRRKCVSLSSLMLEHLNGFFMGWPIGALKRVTRPRAQLWNPLRSNLRTLKNLTTRGPHQHLHRSGHSMATKPSVHHSLRYSDKVAPQSSKISPMALDIFKLDPHVEIKRTPRAASGTRHRTPNKSTPPGTCFYDAQSFI